MMKLFAGILIAIGILLMTGSGLCSLFVIIGTGMGPGAGGIIPIALVIGGIPFGVGFGAVAWGRKILKDQKQISLEELNDRFE